MRALAGTRSPCRGSEAADRDRHHLSAVHHILTQLDRRRDGAQIVDARPIECDLLPHLQGASRFLNPWNSLLSAGGIESFSL